MNEQENTKVAEQLYETFNSGDFEGFLNTFTEDAIWNSPEMENVPVETNVTGRDNIGKLFAEIEEFEEILKIKPKEFITQGDKVVVLGEMQARSKTTDKQYDSGFVHIIGSKTEKPSAF